MRHRLLMIVVMLAIIALFALSAEAATKGKGPVLHMRFDEGGGPTAYDEGWTDTDSDGIKDSGESWNNYDGTLTPGAAGSNTAAGEMWSTQGKIGSALELDGTDDTATLTNISFAAADPWTISAWIYQTGSKSFEFVIGQNVGGKGINLDDVSGRIQFRDLGGTYHTWNIGFDYKNAWHHFVWVATGSTSIELYVDGKSYGTVSADSTFVVNRIGNAYSNNSWCFTGKIDDVKVYDYTRSAAQIMVDYNAGAASHLAAGTDPNEGNSPVGYWPFDENTGTNAYDRSGTGNNGTVTDATWAQGKNGPCLNFDGSGDYVTLSSEPFTASNAEYTISLWARHDTVPSDSHMRYISWGSASGRYFFGWDKNQLKNTIGHGSVTIIPADSSYRPTPGVWEYWTVTNSGTTTKFYKNGVLINTETHTATGAIITTTYPVRIGRQYGTNTEYFDGLIDDVKIYDYARTPGQIAYDYSRGAPVAHYRFDEGAGTIAKNDSSSSHDGAAPVGWWKMDEASWNGTANEVVDSSGNANHGVRGADARTTSSSKIGPYAGTFDGTGDYVQGPSSNDITGDNLQTITMSAWVKTSSTSSQYMVALKRQASHSTLISLCSNYGGSGYLGLLTRNSADTTHTALEHSGSYSDGAWHHVVGVVDGATRTLYIDGVQRGTDSDGMQSVTGNTAYFAIGAFDSTQLYFTGQIDDVRIYTYARTAEQIYNDYRSTHGTMVGDTKFVDGKIGKALEFDGTGDYVDFGDDASFYANGTSFTAEAWFKDDGTSASFRIVQTRGTGGAGTQAGFQVSGDTSNWNNLFIDDGSGNFIGGSNGGIIAMNELDGNWHHIALVFDSTTGNRKIYIDGLQKSNYTYASLIGADFTTSRHLSIGAAWDSGSSQTQFFNGLIDDVRIYNYARTAAQIAEDYADGASRLSTQTAGVADPWGGALPVGHWKLDENTGVLARDASENTNDGTITGATWAQGKLGPGLSLDGNDDYVNILDASTLEGMSALTLAAWVNVNSFPTQNNGILSKGSTYRFTINLAGGVSFTVATANNAWYTEGTNTGGGTVEAGYWYHLVGVYDGSLVKLYVDGDFISQGSQTISGNIVSNSNPVRIADLASGNIDYYNGSVDDARIYNYALTPAQVSWLYNTGKPVGYWRMDEATTGAANGSTIYDDMKSNNVSAWDGANDTGMTWATGKFGGALSFDGVDDYAAGAGITGVRSSTGTFSYWIKPTTKDTAHTPFHLFELGYTDFIRSHIDANNLIDLVIEDENVSQLNVEYDLDNLGAFENQWWHVTWVQDGSSVKLYINGELKTLTGTNSGSWWTDHLASSLTLRLARGWGYFQGLMDDFRIYNYPRTADQIKQDYNNGVATKLSD